MKITRKLITEIPQFRKAYGREFVLLRKEGRVSLYVTKTLSGAYRYEIALWQIDKETVGIFYPPTGQWGQNAFTTMTVDRAHLKFDQLREKEISQNESDLER